MAGNKRFETVYKESGLKLSSSKIIKDNETGVLYLFHYDGYAGGLTVMVDKDGKPLTGK